jgi:orotidine-5'-phosphate decarboxylase
MRTRKFKDAILQIEVYENKKSHLTGAKGSVVSEPIIDAPVEDTESGRKIIVRGVGNAFSKDVRAQFEKYGKIVDYKYNISKGKAIITYEKDQQAMQAISDASIHNPFPNCYKMSVNWWISEA